jgi:hypothetical protein
MCWNKACDFDGALIASFWNTRCNLFVRSCGYDAAAMSTALGMDSITTAEILLSGTRLPYGQYGLLLVNDRKFSQRLY